MGVYSVLFSILDFLICIFFSNFIFGVAPDIINMLQDNVLASVRQKIADYVIFPIEYCMPSPVRVFVASKIGDLLMGVVLYIGAKTGVKLVVKIREYVVAPIKEYVTEENEGYRAIESHVVAPIGDYAVEKIRKHVMDPIGEYFLAPIGNRVLVPVGLGPIRDYVVAPTLRQLRYLRHKSNIRDCRNQIEDLRSVRVVVKGLVDATAAEGNGQVSVLNVEKWLTSVDEIVEESRNVFDDEIKGCLKLFYQGSRNGKEKTT